MSGFDPTASGSAPTRALFALRLRIGTLLGWDRDARARPVPGCVETTLAARLPEALRGSADATSVGTRMRHVAGGFVPVYRTPREWAAELSNATVHGVLHLSWVAEGGGRYRGRMAVYVKPRGLLGEAYMRFIDPYRHLVVYPALMNDIARARATRRPAPRVAAAART